MNILAAQNRKSGNLEIGVPVLGNHVFVLDYLSISMGIFVKVLSHLRCVVAFTTNIVIEIMIFHLFHLRFLSKTSTMKYTYIISF